jgi:hypothetical protein
MKEKHVPRLDLSPRLKRRLSIWKPLDYLLLLYWVFFFPQAIRWYVEQFGNHKYQYEEGSGSWKKFREAWREDPVIRRLVVHNLVLMGIVAIGISWGFSAVLISLDLYYVFLVFVVGMIVSASTVVVKGVAFSMAYGTAVVTWFGVSSGLFIGIMKILAGTAEEVLALFLLGFIVFLMAVFGGICLTYGVLYGVLNGLSGGVATEVVDTFGRSVVGGVLGGLFLGVIVNFAFSTMYGTDIGVTVGIAFIAAIILLSNRLFDYILLIFFNLFAFKINNRFRFPQHGRLAFLPLPGLKKRLEEWFQQDWTTGVHNANQFLEFSLQFIPVVNAVNNVLSQSPPDTLLKKISILADQPYDWQLLQFGAADLNKRLKKEFISLYSEKYKNKIKLAADMRIDTFPRAACAGFWYWHKRDATQAADAFARVRELAYGEELYNSAIALQKGLEISDVNAVTSWEDEAQWLETLPGPGLRPGTIKALRILKTVAGEARTALRSHSLVLRSTAVNRAVDSLSNLAETGGHYCPEPEWPLVQDIARKWLDLFQTLGGQVGKEVLRTPIRNPYIGYSGLPICDESFVGREDILRKIETRWAEDSPLPALFLYGHRRMGKTSILKNLEKTSPPSSIYMYLNMQDTTWITHTGQFLLDIANALHPAAQKIIPDVCTPPQKKDYTDLGTARQALNSLLKSIHARIDPPQRIILAMDEFEYIEKGINEKKIDPGLLDYLRAINQDYPWLGLIFAGLHTLEEMGRDYKAAFFGQAEARRVSFLTYDETLQLITQPDPDFSLEYDDSLIDEIYRLTHGQPYLVQRICWELVNRWNDRFLKEGENTPRTLLLEDLLPILTADFFQAADYYFSGVWSNITKPEQTLLRIMSTGENTPRTRKELAAASHQDEQVERAIELLLRHDVIVEDEKGLRFANELMRRWVEENASGDRHVAH